jgi:hypothetical protein
VDEVTSQLLTHGVLGPVVVALAWAYWKKDAQLQACMAERTREAVVAMKLMTEGTEAMKESTEAIRENTKAVQELGRRVP